MTIEILVQHKSEPVADNLQFGIFIIRLIFVQYKQSAQVAIQALPEPILLYKKFVIHLFQVFH